MVRRLNQMISSAQVYTTQRFPNLPLLGTEPTIKNRPFDGGVPNSELDFPTQLTSCLTFYVKVNCLKSCTGSPSAQGIRQIHCNVQHAGGSRGNGLPGSMLLVKPSLDFQPKRAACPAGQPSATLSSLLYPAFVSKRT